MPKPIILFLYKITFKGFNLKIFFNTQLIIYVGRRDKLKHRCYEEGVVFARMVGLSHVKVKSDCLRLLRAYH